ncbi:hypothetical protein SRABI13_02788 [Erwinia aphidicola]|nr:hypothetical protein SRABI13_02788 [Erwinia aphidicola]
MPCTGIQLFGKTEQLRRLPDKSNPLIQTNPPAWTCCAKKAVFPIKLACRYSRSASNTSLKAGEGCFLLG